VARNDVEVRLSSPQRPAARPLLPPAARRPAVALLAVCVAVTAVLGVLFAHQTQPGWLDSAIDARLRSGLSGYPALLNRVSMLGTLGPVAAMTTAMAVACLATRRWRGALLAVIAVPTAEVITELVLKPLVDRTMRGQLSFPSGHTTGVFVLAAVFTVLMTGPPRPRLPAAARVPLILAAYLAATATAVAMIGMGAHYFTDTVGAVAVAVGTVLATALAIDKLTAPDRRPAPARPERPGPRRLPARAP
jgi:membrane-associated phospholipid phosphatase